MAGLVPVCDPCKKAPRRGHGSILCHPCAEAVSRVMSCDLYEVNYYKNRQAQLAQARLLIRAVRDSDSSQLNSRRWTLL